MEPKFSQGINYIVLTIGLLFPWNQIGLQYHLYLGSAEVERLIVYLSALFVLVLIALSLFVKVPRRIFLFIVGYVSLTLAFYLLVIAGADGAWHRYFGVLFYSSALIWIVSDKHRLKQFVILNFLLGFIMICLNTTTLLHWYDIIDLSNQSVPRVGGNTDGSDAHLDPVSFGLFGRTENHIHPNNFLKSARLQGWSSEPLHWSYFVYWTLVCALLLFAEARTKKVKNLLKMSFLIIIFHAIYLQSSTANIILLGTFIAGIFMSFKRIRLLMKYDYQKLFLVTVLAPGILIPLVLSLVPDIREIFGSANILGEQGNWGGKLSFLNFGDDLVLRVFPDPGAYEPVSHNLIIGKYIEGGYLFLMMMLLFFYFFLKNTLRGKNLLISIVLILTVVTNTLGVETAFFSSFGIMWFGVVYAFLHYSNSHNRYIRSVTPERPKPLVPILEPKTNC